MKIITACVSWVILSVSAFPAQMASQPWVNSRLDALHTNILNEVSHYAPSGGVSKAYVDEGLSLKQDKLTAGNGISITTDGVISAVGGGSHDYNPETDMWVEDGTNLCFMAGTNKVKFAILSVTSQPYARGLFVVDSGNADGVVSNGVFFAEVETGKFRCPSNQRMPLIEFDGINTQVVDGVTNEYQRVTAIEYERGTNGVMAVNRYESAQKNQTDWIMRSILGDLSVRDFRIRMTMGPDLLSGPSAQVQRSRLSKLFFGSSGAGMSMDFSIQGMSGNLIITLIGVNKPIVVPIVYSGPLGDFNYAAKDPNVPRKERSKPDAEGKVTVTHWDWDIYPCPSYSSFTALANWIPAMLSYTYTTERGDTYVKNIPISAIQQLFGMKLAEKLAALWQEPRVVEWTSEEYTSCRGDGKLGHYFMEKTCKCRYCGAVREHLFNPGDPGMTCKTCINRIGWERDPLGSYCGGHSLKAEDHGGYHHTPEQGWNPLPSTGLFPGHQGYLVTCSCQCGDITDNHAYGDYSEVRYSRGDLWGMDEDKYHTKSMVCSRCQLSLYGWKAEVEGHKVSETECFIECIKAGTFDDDTGEYEPCLPEDPNVDREGHAAEGRCELCQKPDVAWKVAHRFSNGNSCECTECGAKMHVFCDNTCPGVAWCILCNKVFAVQNGVVNYDLVLDQETEPKHHKYADPESRLKENYDDHVCVCVRRILHPHTWCPVSGNDSGKMVCGDAPDGTAGCGMEKDHEEDSCDEEKCKPYGKCGNWMCRICKKNISGYEGAPGVHGQKGEDGSYGPEKDKVGNITFCAVCKHTFKGVKCGTNSDGVYTPHEIHDPELHIGWEPDGETAHEKEWNHVCACGAYARSHNEVKFKADKIENDYQIHKVLLKCDRDRFDDCHHVWNRIEWHNFVNDLDETTGLPNYVSREEDEKCTVDVVCNVFVDGTNIGCNLPAYDIANHEWHDLPTLGETDKYELGSEDPSSPEYNKHFRVMKCNHLVVGKDGNLHRCGCGHKRAHHEGSGYDGEAHAYRYPETSQKIDGTNHSITVNCDKKIFGCNFTTNIVKSHNYQLAYYTNITEATHTKVEKCKDEQDGLNPGCGDTKLTTLEHGENFVRMQSLDNIDHGEYHVCPDCKHPYIKNTERHPCWNMPDSEWFIHVWNGDVPGQGDPYAFCLWGMHSSATYCLQCGGRVDQPYSLACEYEWNFSDGGIADLGTCKLCRHEVENPCHATVKDGELVGTRIFNEKYHACFHTCSTGAGILRSPAHLLGIHDTDGYTHPTIGTYVPGACSVCGHIPGTYYYDGTISPKMPLLSVGTWSEFIGRLMDGAGLVGPTADWNPPLKIVDGDEPVYDIGNNALTNAFENCESLHTVKFNFVTNVADSAFIFAFNGCTNLTSVQFRDLEKIEEGAFANSFVDCKPISLTFPSLKKIGGHAFYFCNGITNIVANKVSVIEEVAFQGCVNLQSVSLGATEIGIGVFADCVSLTNINLTSLTTYKYDPYWGIRSGATIHFADGDFVVP